MARLNYKIGFYDFLSIEGNPLPPSEMITLDQRHGVNGTELTRVGKKGEPFQLVTHRDYPTFLATFNYLKFYQDLIGKPPVSLIIADENMDWFNFKINVLAVRPIRRMALGQSVGNLSPAPAPSEHLGFMSCLWDVISTEI